MFRRSLILALIVAFATLSSAESKKQRTTVGGKTNTVISGEERTEKERDILMKSLNRYRTSTRGARRFEIVFFVSLPVTLWLSWTLMEFMIRKTKDTNNPKKEFQSPHYIYMFSSSILTSFYIAAQDHKRHGTQPHSGPAERKVSIPIFGLYF